MASFQNLSQVSKVQVMPLFKHFSFLPFFPFFFAVLEFEHRAYTLSHSTSPFL
jgi:hypothetical protein